MRAIIPLHFVQLFQGCNALMNSTDKKMQWWKKKFAEADYFNDFAAVEIKGLNRKEWEQATNQEYLYGFFDKIKVAKYKEQEEEQGKSDGLTSLQSIHPKADE